MAHNQSLGGSRFMFQNTAGEVIHGCLPYNVSEMNGVVLPAKIEEDQLGGLSETNSVRRFESTNNTSRAHKIAAAEQQEAQKRLDKINWLKAKGFLKDA